jgi:hypothetical protein
VRCKLTHSQQFPAAGNKSNKWITFRVLRIIIALAEAAIIIIDFVCARLRSLLGKNGGARIQQFANIGAELF